MGYNRILTVDHLRDGASFRKRLWDLKQERRLKKMAKSITYDDKNVYIKFDYHPNLVMEVKKISVRYFDWDKKFWYVPIDVALDEVIKFAQDFLFDVPPELIELNKQKKAIRKSNLINSGKVKTDFKVEGLKLEPYPFQNVGIEYIVKNKRVILGDEMGLGKTIQAIGAIVVFNKYPVLVGCPKSAKYTWAKEIRDWCDIKCQILDTQGAINPKARIFIINYDIISKLSKRLKNLKIKVFVFDESHYLQNGKTKRSDSVKELVKDSEVRILMTGTVITNRTNEIINQLDILGKLDDFGGFWKFATRYCGAKKVNGRLDVKSNTNSEELHKKLRETCYIRRNKSEVMKELPPIQRTIVPVSIDNMMEYRKAEADFIYNLSEDGSRRDKPMGYLAEIQKLKYISAKGKLNSVLEWSETFLKNDEKLVLFAYHVDIVKKLAKDLGCNYIIGDTPGQTRFDYVESFQKNIKTRCIVLSLGTGRENYTLTSSSNVGFIEQWWNPGVHDQAEARLHRITQKKMVNAWYFIDRRVVDGDIYDLIEDKRKTTDVVNAGKLDKNINSNIYHDLVKVLLNKK